MLDRLDRQEQRDEDAPPVTWQPVALEHEILCALEARPAPGEQLELAYRRKEVELMRLFAAMSIGDSRELHRRLLLCLDGDQIAARFKGLIAQRRARLAAFLADARWRSAVGGR